MQECTLARCCFIFMSLFQRSSVQSNWIGESEELVQSYPRNKRTIKYLERTMGNASGAFSTVYASRYFPTNLDHVWRSLIFMLIGFCISASITAVNHVLFLYIMYIMIKVNHKMALNTSFYQIMHAWRKSEVSRRGTIKKYCHILHMVNWFLVHVYWGHLVAYRAPLYHYHGQENVTVSLPLAHGVA